MAECKGCKWNPVMRLYQISLDCPLHGTPRSATPVDKFGVTAEWEAQLTPLDRIFLKTNKIKP